MKSTRAMAAIAHATIKRQELSVADQTEMFSLMRQYYLGVEWGAFQRDLAEKEHVVVLRESGTRRLVGFSTLVQMDLDVCGELVRAIFSGDTVVETSARHTLGFGREITLYFARTLEEFPNREIYYVLICKGWRTYRVPMLLFNEFSPAPGHPTLPRHQQVMDAFGRAKYPHQYHPEAGLIVYQGEAQRVRPRSAEDLPTGRTSKATEWFAMKNPDYLRGDDLVTVAQVAEQNFSPVFRRLSTS